jgi:hypothetical protein
VRLVELYEDTNRKNPEKDANRSWPSIADMLLELRNMAKAADLKTSWAFWKSASAKHSPLPIKNSGEIEKLKRLAREAGEA